MLPTCTAVGALRILKCILTDQQVIIEAVAEDSPWPPKLLRAFLNPSKSYYAEGGSFEMLLNNILAFCAALPGQKMRKGVEERIPTVNQLRISGTGRRVGSWPSWCCSSFLSDPWPSWTCSWVCWWRRHLGSQGGPLTNLGCWRLSWGDVRERNQGTTLNNSIHFASFLGPCSDFSEAERMWTAPVLFGHVHFFPVKFVSLLPPFSDGPILTIAGNQDSVHDRTWTVGSGLCQKVPVGNDR